MKAIQLVMLSLCIAFATSANAEYAPNLPEVCYDTVEGEQFCTTDNVGKVQVYVYNAGWCPPCNSEMQALPNVYKKFDGEPVVFASLSGEGWRRGQQPDAEFLRSWQEKHRINFVVAGKFKDFGKHFNSPGSIPFAVIIDKEGNVAKSGNLSPSKIESEVRRLLKK